MCVCVCLFGDRSHIVVMTGLNLREFSFLSLPSTRVNRSIPPYASLALNTKKMDGNFLKVWGEKEEQRGY